MSSPRSDISPALTYFTPTPPTTTHPDLTVRIIPPCQAGPPIKTLDTVTNSSTSSLSNSRPTPPLWVRTDRLSRLVRRSGPARSTDAASVACPSSIW